MISGNSKTGYSIDTWQDTVHGVKIADSASPYTVSHPLYLMGRRGKRGHGGPKGKGQSGGSHDKKKPGDPVDGSVVVKGKGGSTTPVHVRFDRTRL